MDESVAQASLAFVREHMMPAVRRQSFVDEYGFARQLGLVRTRRGPFRLSAIAEQVAAWGWLPRRRW